MLFLWGAAAISQRRAKRSAENEIAKTLSLMKAP
jgi:hypothetical protein